MLDYFGTDVSMKQNDMKTSIQRKGLRSVIVMIMALALSALAPIDVLSQSSTGDDVSSFARRDSQPREMDLR